MMTAVMAVLGFDTETTGVRVHQDRIVTAALVTRQADGSVSERGWLIDPGVEIPANASAVHGITTEHAREHGAQPAQALEEIAAAIVADAALPIVAFNASYDLAILDADLTRHGLATLVERLGRPVAPILDPLVLDRGADRFRRGKRTLGDLVEHYRVGDGQGLHDATADVRATIAVLDSILAAFPGLAEMSSTQLHEWQVGKHREWAEGFNEWLVSKGRTGDVNPVWP
jgi:DNA polymerase-3 subunit epsilon